jgi:hypothetical protein
MRSLQLCTLIGVIALSSSGASARSRFVSHDDGQTIRVGEGGVSVASDGVEYWITGSPAGRYRVVGTLTDQRSAGRGGGSAIGSSRLARRVRALGGDGLILVDRREQDHGLVGVWSGGDSAAWQGTRASSVTTTFAVVQYLD